MSTAGHSDSVLIVEDDSELRDNILVPGLKGFGFDAIGVGSALGLYQCLIAKAYRLVVLDVGLPDEDGFSITRRLRETNNVGIVMLTGLDSASHRVQGLQGGADVYLTKPVDIEVLAASLHSLLRRIDGLTTTSANAKSAAWWQLEAGGWRLVSPAGRVIALSPIERIIVTRLASSPNQPVPRDILLSDIDEGIKEFDPHRLEMVIHRLRKKAIAKAGEELPLVSVRGVGYMLELKSLADGGSVSALPH